MKQEDITEFLLVTATAGLGIVAAGTNNAAQMGALAGGVLWAWQKQNAEHFLSVLTQKCQRLNREKLDYSALESNEFKALMIQVVDTASKTASEQKREALANALINSVVPPTSSFSGKQALLRVLSGMSDEEMLALTALQTLTALDSMSARVNKSMLGNKIILLEHLAQETGWSKEENRIAFQGLKQLGIVDNFGFGSNPQEGGGNWAITSMGDRLIQWVTQPS